MSGPQVIHVSDELQLNQAIALVDSVSTGSYVIQFTADITEGTDTGEQLGYAGKVLLAPPDLYALNIKSGVSVTIDGGGHTLSGDNTYRGFFAYAGAVTIQNLKIDNTLAKGGNGAYGGGGGAGLGGGLFVGASAQVTLSGVSFGNDKAQGGDGGHNFQRLGYYLAGGGLGGDGGVSFRGGGVGGGGIGATAVGASYSNSAGSGIVLGAPSPAHRQPGSAPYGGGGQQYDGGGIGSTATSTNVVSGNGGFGGGGGAGRDVGGNGGFGGGGGAGYQAGGDGGFGGGGGGGPQYGYGGFGAGSGGKSIGLGAGGGGGLGAGGAIFVQEGGTLVIGAGGISGSSVQAGLGGYGFNATGQNGSAFGSGIFVEGFGTLTFAPGASQTLTISDGIADQSGSGGTGVNAGHAALLINGPGTVVLGGNSTFTGGTTVQGAGAVLSISKNANLGAPSSGLTLDNGTTLELTGSFTLTHAISLAGDPIFDVAAGKTVSITAPITDGIVPGDIDKTGTGTLVLNAVDTYSGGTVLEAGRLVLGNAQAAGSGAITFAQGASALLEIDGTVMPANTIDGFVAGDGIVLGAIVGVAGAHADMNYSTNVLTVTKGTASFQLHFNPNESFAGDFFHLSAVSGGTEITENTTPCYCPGTCICTSRGETPVEELEIGDEVMTASGALRPIKWIGRRSFFGHFVTGRRDILPVCIKAGALGDNLPKRDLWISPHHAMYFEGERGGVLIEARDLLNGVSIVQAEHVDKIEYFHIELETHDVIIAEGALSESFVDDNSRGMFHNAHEFRALYPDEVPAAAARYCAPRLEQGFEVETVRQRIARRAGAQHLADSAQVGALRGLVDQISEVCIAGWAQNADHPEVPVCLDIVADGRVIGQVLANRFREDLRQAGLGSGHHAFKFVPPAGIAIRRESIRVQRSLDGAALMARRDAANGKRLAAA